MKLTAQDYEILIKKSASELSLFARIEGTSLSFKYMREVCARLEEISLEYEAQFPKEAKKDYDQQ